METSWNSLLFQPGFADLFRWWQVKKVRRVSDFSFKDCNGIEWDTKLIESFGIDQLFIGEKQVSEPYDEESE